MLWVVAEDGKLGLRLGVVWYKLGGDLSLGVTGGRHR